MLEQVRRRLRKLIKLIERRSRKTVYTDFEDAMGQETEIELGGITAGTDYEKFKAKAQAFLRSHQENAAIQKLRTNKPLTGSDIAELERILIESGTGGAEDIGRAKTEAKGLGSFVRSLVGLDRNAAKEAFSVFSKDLVLTANQLEFVNMIIDHLVEHGMMEPSLLYESPFTDLAPHGPNELFDPKQMKRILSILSELRLTAQAA